MSQGQKTLDDLARRTGLCVVARRVGLTPGAVANHIAGRRVPSAATRETYRDVLGISPEAW